MLSVFLRDPQFQGQTKDRLVSTDATRQTEQAVRDRFDQWLSADALRATFLLDTAIERADDRKRRKKEKEVARKSATRRLRLPGKLADCSSSDTEATELFWLRVILLVDRQNRHVTEKFRQYCRFAVKS